ncbi:membrane-binding protein [Flavobacterium salilacus subsp. salilacus]|uniref:toxin-antitoxin system YwqK family antitoxin n=1 Tax=Flavobacterium TaxID=237 RepID=UPI001075046A|nr:MULTISPECIES: membrane-binding protein [Flavobacterium]KAF2520164.1 membrane-binding protein [Flavobacterium salilacus subsp. salilacus]MBE1613920.1 membrane-binding protein [Flavobacterium sp. SaA2.13]NDI97971.1 membrane-binding protein [Flavobacterium salilacus subsp. altitudinum]
MKKIIIAALMLSAGMLSAQEIKPKYEIESQMVKATYYYDNGNIKQQGFYKDGKLHGKWVAFNENGTKQSIGEYANGVKTGKWFFWSDATLSEVDYTDSRIADIKRWSREAVVVNK